MAVKLFNERGYNGTSMEDLSRKLGITKSTIYHHVPSKEELLRLATGRALDGLFAEAAKLDKMGGRAVDRLEHLVHGSVMLLARELPFVGLLLRVRGNTKAEQAALARRPRRPPRGRAGHPGRRRGGPVPRRRPGHGRPAAVRRGQLADRWYRPHGPAAAEELADPMVTVAFDGLRITLLTCRRPG